VKRREKEKRKYTMIPDNADNNSDAFLHMHIWKQVISNDKKKRTKKNKG
jgi:hypothetical protein